MSNLAAGEGRIMGAWREYCGEGRNSLSRKLKSVSTADTIELDESFAHHAAVKSNEERAYMFLAVSLSVDGAVTACGICSPKASCCRDRWTSERVSSLSGSQRLRFLMPSFMVYSMRVAQWLLGNYFYVPSISFAICFHSHKQICFVKYNPIRLSSTVR